MAARPDGEPVDGAVSNVATRGLRVAPLFMGITFITIAITALALSPDGFDQRAILLWPATVVLLATGGFWALIAHLLSRRR